MLNSLSLATGPNVKLGAIGDREHVKHTRRTKIFLCKEISWALWIVGPLAPSARHKKVANRMTMLRRQTSLKQLLQQSISVQSMEMKL